MDIWTYREAVRLEDEQDLTGFTVEATDGEVGTVGASTYERDRSYLVVRTGPWLFGKDVLLPAGVVERVDAERERVYVDRTKDEIKDAPPFALEDRTPEHEEELGVYWSGKTAT